VFDLAEVLRRDKLTSGLRTVPANPGNNQNVAVCILVVVASNGPVIDGRRRVGFGIINTPCKFQVRSKRGPPGRSEKEPVEGCDRDFGEGGTPDT